MKAPIVRLKLRVRLADGSRPYLEPVLAAGGKLKPGYAILHNSEVHHPGSVYHLRYQKHGKRVWEPVRSEATLAMVEKFRREEALAARAAGVSVAEEGLAAPKLTSLDEAVAEYLGEVKVHKPRKTDAPIP